ncbi:hypothetical protein NQ318_009535 [Aromia moschata]|uniref:DNA-directed RNA polymerase n=1 Tax=Aromia moschata TaxID=1265417 RepID=A0AAV8Y860_9CUCU|nr:hypothetical protein NQ318_009535 [Aromia moschata]
MLTRVSVSDILEKIDVTVELQLEPIRQHKYILKFDFLPEKCYSNDYYVTPRVIINHMKKKFFGEMFTAIRKFSKVKTNIVMMEEAARKKIGGGRNQDDEGEENDDREKDPSGPVNDQSSSEDEVEDEEDAKTTNKYQQAHEQQEPEEEEKEASDEESGNEEENPDPENQPEQDNSVVEMHRAAQNYREDKKLLWCEITFALPLNFKKLDLSVLLKEAAAKSIMWETPNIKRAITYMKDDTMTLRTDGINIVEMFKYRDLLDLKRLYCNDIHKMAETYGIEAASKIIVKEVKDVFNVYGIKVDPRHLSLIADYMTFNGTFEPMSRRGMENSASPLQQISFESSLVFLRNATIRGKEDNLQNPSSSLMIGKPCGTGTGGFTISTPPPPLSI